MDEKSNDLNKLVAVATDLGLAAKIRTQAIGLIGNISTHDALLALLDLAANDKLTKEERQLALKHAGQIIKKGL